MRKKVYALGRDRDGEVPDGYGVLIETGEDRVQNSRLLVPMHVIDAILKDQESDEAAEKAEREEREGQDALERRGGRGSMAAQAQVQDTTHAGLPSRPPGSLGEPRLARSPFADKLFIDIDNQLEPAVTPEGHHRVWDSEQMRARVDLHNSRSTADRDWRERDFTHLKKILERGPFLPIKMPVDLNELQHSLREGFGAFDAVIDLVCSAIAGGGSIPPILIVADPGVGKTFFAHALAEALEVADSVIDVATQPNSSFLAGSQRNWSNTEVGLIFRLLLLNKHACANPLIILDELDKSGDQDSYPFLPSLLGLLEQSSARRYRDASLDVELDASLVTWIATANSAKPISSPLRDRFHVFFPKPQTASQQIHVAWSVARAVVERAGLRQVPREIVVAMAGVLTPRQIRKVLEAAAGRAKLAGRSAIIDRDIGALGGGSVESLH